MNLGESWGDSWHWLTLVTDDASDRALIGCSLLVLALEIPKKNELQ